MRSRLVSSLLAIASVLASTPFTHAAVQNRVVSAVNNGSRVSLSGTISGRAKHSVDLGQAPEGRQLTLSLMFSMTAAQQADLNQLLAAQLDPASPSYHQWLTPEQFGARFGLSSGDLAKVSAWLTSQGFTITSVARSSNYIEFSGTIAQAQQAFGASIHTVTFNGEQHFTNLTEVALPSAIASVVASVSGLDDFHAKPRSRPRTVSPADPTRPQYTQTVCPNSSVPCHYISPADLYTIYNYTPLTTASTPINGAGVTIAVIGQTDLTTGNVLPDANITAFRTAAGLPAINLQVKVAGTDPGLNTDIDEAHIDIEWSGASAPGAAIVFVTGADVFKSSLPYAVSNKVGTIISSSYGLCEPGWATASLNTINQLLAQANAQGQTFVSASGDSGATDCDVSGLASEGQTVDFPSSSPYSTSAGGTMFSGDLNSPGSYWSTSNGTNGSSVLSYIPEQPWNETTASAGLDAGGAGGGGASALFSKPAWQTGIGVPNDSTRDLPDISMNAAAEHDGYLVCSQGGFSGEPACTSGFLGSGSQVNVFGGTSFVAPIFSGILALVEQQLGTPTAGLGNVGPKLYGFLNGPTYSSVFHDINTGNNSVPCSQGTPNCQNGGSTGFSAGTGYDQASGIGSFDVSKLVTGWSAVTPVGTGGTVGAGISTTALTTSSAICGVTGSLALSVTVTGSVAGTTPTGTVQFFVDNAAVTGSTTTLSSGTATYSLSTAGLSSGAHMVSAVYSGDGNYAGSKGTLFGPAVNPNIYVNGQLASVDVVSSTKADFGFTPCIGTATTVTVQPGATSSGVTLTVTPANGFTGSVNLIATNNDGMTGTATFTPPTVNVTTGAVTTSLVVQAFQTTTAQLTRPDLKPQHPSGRIPWYAAGSGATLACMLLFLRPRRRRWGALLAAVLSIAIFTVAGCGGNTSTTGGGGGGGGGGGSTTNPAAAGTYTFTITAISGTLVHSTQVTVIVP